MAHTKQSIDILQEIAHTLGYTTKFLQDNGGPKRLLISNGTKLYIANSTTFGFYPEVQRWQQHLFDSKTLTQEVLAMLGYKTIETFTANYRNYDSYKQLYEKMEANVRQFPVLIKQENGARGKNITIAENKAMLWKITKKNYLQKRNLLVQPILQYDEYRILVVHGIVEVVHKKQMYFVVGDGKRTIKQLLKEKDSDEQDTYFIARQLKKRNLKKSSVLPTGEKFLSHITRYSAPESYLVAPKIPKEVALWAERLSRRISSDTIGIDIFAPHGLLDTKRYIVIELNANPAFEYFERRYNDKAKTEEIARNILRHYFND